MLSVISYFLSLILIWRVFVFELIWILPRQPITGLFISLFFHRVACLYLDETLYTYISHLFDGDATPRILIILFAINVTNYVTKPGVKPSRFVILVMLLTSMSWLVRIIDAEWNHSDIYDNINWLHKHSSLKSESLNRVFTLQEHFLNSKLSTPLLPDKTAVFKKISLAEAKNNNCEEGFFAIPGDHPDSYFASWEKFEKTGEMELDIFFQRNKSISNPRIILYLHGGGWEKGHRHFLSQNYHGGVPDYLLDNNIIISPSYRMSCMDLTGPEILEDVYDAVKYIIEHSESLLAINRNQLEIVPWGTSAGATLALLLAYQHATELKIPGVINFYGVTEFREAELLKQPKSFFEEFHYGLFIQFSRHICEKVNKDTNQLEQIKHCFEEFSPVAHVNEFSVPTLTIHGQQDGLVLVDHAHLLKEKLRSSNVTEVTIDVQGGHDCDVLASSFCSQAAVYAVDAFLNKISEP